ncbi:uncharacterized protein BO97DRAFT_409245 [Aspergillus homomorphus CBS 101889]|uniref:Zf-PARP-domain-containing protein n=1 Tax=Aspergillus homomorphus (strain CBS 101889) TaxID=1450537 RepID=A0A395HIW2_ASPHC|nr:zf-PARP-domain-containing protein [Aspergillus homomorphus CBS 101889]RAL07115.1 zf-PARP-domain-containing protein [Aspergillus homomorphus CBS 101889]
MGAYRLDESTGRAGCQNKECKDAKVKIAKGELRHGSWVDTGNFQSWKYRHWGCVTPQVIKNLNEAIDELSNGDEKDYSALDGFDELSPENQEKVRRALEQGHVDDADWKGDVEVNRPGMTGFRKKVTKKEAAAKQAQAEDHEEEEDEASTPKSKKRSRPQTKKQSKAEVEADGNDEQEEEAPKPKRSKKSAQPKPLSDDEEDVKPVTSKRGRPAKSKAAAEESPEAPAPAKKRTAKKPTKAVSAPVGDEEKPKRGRKKTARV